ncbi:hypothetical protein [Rhizobium sp. CSW-27]|uniref:hypothetical protein n=1 Tax=Rhizobium sp. CSW-27 TaxID=2839985 RepID=UPI001C031A58|nr:hypothetical protein [Rhizobium sp. CSW-27]MBT9370304.1 hypothetical protein [Rhizobium sp. CSW-27]
MDAPDDDCADAVHGLRHTALRNALYHVARRGWLDGISRILNLAVIVGGTAYAADIAKGNTNATLLLGMITAVIGALQLVFDFGGRARDHQLLQKRYYDVLAAIEENRAPNLDDCARWKAELTRIYADEPPTLRALDAIADNQATAAIMGARKPRLHVTFYESMTRHIFMHNSGTFHVNEGWQD